MRKLFLIVTSVAVASFLVGVVFNASYLTTSGKLPSVWDAINELQAKVNSLNNTVIEQQTQISELHARAGGIAPSQTIRELLFLKDPLF